MITLNMRLTANPGREAELSSAIRDRWMKAMSRQPGFIRGVLLKPYEGELAAKVGLTEQDFTFEVVSFWESEEQRAAWAASDIHAEVIAYVNDAILPEVGQEGRHVYDRGTMGSIELGRDIRYRQPATR